MALRSGLDEVDSMNMTPMVDVVMNLLIFFMLSSTFASEERELELQLPTVAAAAPLTEAPDEIAVKVMGDGRIAISDQTLTLDQLADRLRKARQNFPEQAVSIRGDAAVRYEKVAQVIAACKRSGIQHLDVLVTQE